MNYGLIILIVGLFGGISTIGSGFLKGRAQNIVLVACGLSIMVGAWLTFVAPPPATATLISKIPAPTASPRVLALSLYNDIIAFATHVGPQKILITTIDDSESISYADTIAKAFQKGNWTIEGLGPLGLGPGGHVRRRLGVALPEEPALAIAGSDQELVNGVRSIFKNSHVAAEASWPPDESPLVDGSGGQIAIFVGRYRKQ